MILYRIIYYTKSRLQDIMFPITESLTKSKLQFLYSVDSINGYSCLSPVGLTASALETGREKAGKAGLFPPPRPTPS